jgi:ankyrin repeat protein
VQAGHWDFANELMNPPYNANLNAQNRLGQSALHLASLDFAKLLVQKGAVLELVSKDGLTPILHHCQLGHTEIVEYLAVAGANVNAKDLGHRTCLHTSAFRGYKSTVLVLLGKGGEQHADGTPKKDDKAEAENSENRKGRSVSDLRAVSLRGNTPLHAAAEPGHIDIINVLLEAGSDASIQNFNGQDPADVAKDEDVQDLLDTHRVFGQKIHKRVLGKDDKIAEAMRPALYGNDIVFTIKSGEVNCYFICVVFIYLHQHSNCLYLVFKTRNSNLCEKIY